LEERLQEVEIKLMDLELIVEQLNQVIIKHESTIEQLTLQLDVYKQQLDNATSVLAPQSEETPPPHY
jgi:SlyX protein